MTTNAARAGILVAAVIVAAIIIANAFPGTGTPAPAAHHSTSPTPTPKQSTKPPVHKLDCKTLTEVQVAVENATSTGGLAAATAMRLKQAGYTINDKTDVGTAATQSQTTTVYFRGAANKDAATCVRKKFFRGAALRPLSATASGGTTPPVPGQALVVVFLGSDYSAAHPLP